MTGAGIGNCNVPSVVPMISPSPSCAGCRQLSGRGWGRGRGRGCRGSWQSHPPASAATMRRRRRRGRRRRGGRGTWARCGIAQGRARNEAAFPDCRKELALILDGARFPLLFLELVEFRHFQSQIGGLSVLHSRRASQQDVGIEAVVLAVFGLAVGEAGETAKAPPVRRAGVRAVPLGKGLGNERGQRCRVHIIVLQPGLEVAEAGFNHGARLKPSPASRATESELRSSRTVKRCSPAGRI